MKRPSERELAIAFEQRQLVHVERCLKDSYTHGSTFTGKMLERALERRMTLEAEAARLRQKIQDLSLPAADLCITKGVQ